MMVLTVCLLPIVNGCKKIDRSSKEINRNERQFLSIGPAPPGGSLFAVRGQRDWKQDYLIKSVMTLSPNTASFITPITSGIYQFVSSFNK